MKRPDWTIETLAPAAPEVFADADLDPLEPLWRSLMDKHRESWRLLVMRTYEESWPRRRAHYRQWLTTPGSFVLVARAGECQLGYAVVGIREGDETYATRDRQAEIHTLVVLPDGRNRGVGSALMDEVERRLLADGITDVFVACMHGNDGAQRFYERRGYEPFVHVSYRKLAEECCIRLRSMRGLDSR